MLLLISFFIDEFLIVHNDIVVECCGAITFMIGP